MSKLRRWISNMFFRRGVLRFKNRSDYKRTWNHLASSSKKAKLRVAGSEDEADFNVTAEHTVSILERFCGVEPTDIILEIGCGVGRVGKVLSKKCARWIGTDISANMLKYAAQRLQGIENIQLVELSTVGLAEIPDESVDVVYSTVVFMHLLEWDRYKYVLESFRVLKPGGRCFFDNLDITSPHGWKMFMKGFSVDISKRTNWSSMTSSGDELRTYAEKAGFENIGIHRWDDAWVGVTGRKPLRTD